MLSQSLRLDEYEGKESMHFTIATKTIYPELTTASKCHQQVSRLLTTPEMRENNKEPAIIQQLKIVNYSSEG